MEMGSRYHLTFDIEDLFDGFAIEHKRNFYTGSVDYKFTIKIGDQEHVMLASDQKGATVREVWDGVKALHVAPLMALVTAPRFEGNLVVSPSATVKGRPPIWSTVSAGLVITDYTASYARTLLARANVADIVNDAAYVEYAVVAGTLPPGWTLATNGALVGTVAGAAYPTGTYNFTVSAVAKSLNARYQASDPAVRAFTLIVL